VIVKSELRGVGALAAAVLSVIAVSACSPTAPGTPGPVSSASSTTTSSGNTVPKVGNPKTLNGIAPCQLLTTQQLADLGATPRSQPKPDTTATGDPSCMWENDNVTVILAPLTKTGKGIEQTYLSKDNYSFFQPTTVDSYPAVLVDKQKLSCGMFLGVSDTQELSLTVVVTGKNNPDSGNPCAFPPKVASAALKNIPAGQ